MIAWKHVCHLCLNQLRERQVQGKILSLILRHSIINLQNSVHSRGYCVMKCTTFLVSDSSQPALSSFRHLMCKSIT